MDATRAAGKNFMMLLVVAMIDNAGGNDVVVDVDDGKVGGSMVLIRLIG